MKTILMIMLGLCPYLFCHAQTFVWDLDDIDNSTFRLHGNGIDTTVTNDGESLEIDVSPETDFYIDLDAGTEKSSTVRVIMEEGSINTIQWKDADESQSGSSYMNIPSRYYSIGNAGKLLKLTGDSLTFDFRTDVDSIFVQQTDSVDSTATYALFPGDYDIETPGTGNEIRFEMDTSGSFVQSPMYFDAERDAEYNLHPHFYDFPAADEMDLLGKATRLDLVPVEDYQLELEEVSGGIGRIGEGSFTEPKLLPGTYEGTFRTDPGGSTTSYFRFRQDNQFAGLGDSVEWKGTGGGASWTDFDLNDFNKKRNDLIILVIPGPTHPTIDYDQWAELKKELDGSWYKTDSRRLRFKYRERYNESTDLDYKIWDDSHTEINLSASTFDISRAFGMNFCEVNLATAGLSNGSYYTLEVSGPKSGKWYLRFKYQ